MTLDQAMSGFMALGFITASMAILVAWIFFCAWLSDIVGSAVGLALVFSPLVVLIFIIGAYVQ